MNVWLAGSDFLTWHLGRDPRKWAEAYQDSWGLGMDWHAITTVHPIGQSQSRRHTDLREEEINLIEWTGIVNILQKDTEIDFKNVVIFAVNHRTRWRCENSQCCLSLSMKWWENNAEPWWKRSMWQGFYSISRKVKFVFKFLHL